MVEVEKLNAVWERLEKWYAENHPTYSIPSGAAPANIIALETHIGLTLPEELKASLMRHDGLDQWSSGELLSVNSIKEYWNQRAEMVDKGYFFDHECLLEPNDFIQKCWMSKSWVPVDSRGGADGHMVDLNPGAKGKVGQVMYFSHETGPEIPVFSNFIEYLEECARKLEAGEFVVMGGYLEERQ